MVFSTSQLFSTNDFAAPNSILLSKTKTFTLTKAIALIFAIGIITHLPSLISDSNMWDDWIILSWIADKRLDWMFQFFHNYGVTPYFFVYFPFVVSLHDPVISNLIARIFVFLGVILTANLIMLISRRVAQGDLLFATLTGVFAVSFPTLSGEAFHLTTVFYYCFIPLFFTGIFLFIRVTSSSNLLLRGFALAALFFSFSLNSLLVLFYAVIPAVFYTFIQGEKLSLRVLLIKARIFFIRYLDFLILPFIFWGTKAVFMPRVGIYAHYNNIRWDWLGILKGYEQLIPDILQITLFVPLSIRFVSWIVFFVFIIAVLCGRSVAVYLESKAKMQKSHLIILLGLGFLALLGAALPYYMVGRRSFQAFGFMSRDCVLFPLSVGWITAALFYMFLKPRSISQRYKVRIFEPFRQRIAFGIIVSLIFVQIVSNWRNHIDWQAHYVYYRSAIEKIVRDKLVNQASIIQVIDHIPGDRTLQTRKYPISIWTEILSVGFQKKTRLAIPCAPENGRFFTQEEIGKRVRESEIDFMLAGINREGRQIQLTIKSTNRFPSPTHLTLAYWRARFLAPLEMPQLLGSITHIKSEQIKK